MVGLMGLTDPKASMQNFRAIRGDDPTGPVSVLTTTTQRQPNLSAVAVYTISGASGFVFGALLTVVLYLCLTKRSQKF